MEAIHSIPHSAYALQRNIHLVIPLTMKLTLFIPLFLVSRRYQVLAFRNITVDDTDTTAITYTPPGAWESSASHLSPLDYGGGHSLGDGDSTTKATFLFTGVAIYYMSPLWPYSVDSAISVDSGPQEIIDLTDNLPASDGTFENIQSDVVWGRSGLTNGPHTVVVSKYSNYVVVDAFIYTVANEDNTSPDKASPSLLSDPSPDSPTQSSSSSSPSQSPSQSSSPSLSLSSSSGSPSTSASSSNVGSSSNSSPSPSPTSVSNDPPSNDLPSDDLPASISPFDNSLPNSSPPDSSPPDSSPLNSPPSNIPQSNIPSGTLSSKSSSNVFSSESSSSTSPFIDPSLVFSSSPSAQFTPPSHSLSTSSTGRSLATTTASSPTSSSVAHSLNLSTRIIVITITSITGAVAITLVTILLINRRYKEYRTRSDPDGLQPRAFTENQATHSGLYADQSSASTTLLMLLGTSGDPITIHKSRHPRSRARTLIVESSRATHPGPSDPLISPSTFPAESGQQIRTQFLKGLEADTQNAHMLRTSPPPYYREG